VRLNVSITTLSAGLLVLLAGCSAGPPPEGAPPPPKGVPNAAAAPSAIVSGASDSVQALPGSPGALYRYRFKQTDPSSDRFIFQDRELSFYMRPTPAAIHMQVENRQDRPASIDWDRSVFVFSFGRTGRIAHATTTWKERFSPMAPTMIPGLARYSDYVFPSDYLVDPAGKDEQLHRMMLPEDESAPSYNQAVFGMDLVFIIEGQPRTYSFRYTVASVLPR
jgi:hypothetical protein